MAGDVLVIYCAGLGAVSPTVAAGSAAPLSLISNTERTPKVTIGGVPARVDFAGLTPQYTGLYQINVVMPESVKPGDLVEVTVAVGNVTSPPVTISAR